MSIFVDTSAIYAGVAASDDFHDAAVTRWAALLEGEEALVTHSLVEIETVALLQRRAGVDGVRAFVDLLLPRLSVVEIDRERRRRSIVELCSTSGREPGVVDQISFDVMTDQGITRAFAFDRHFADAGFELIGFEAA